MNVSNSLAFESKINDILAILTTRLSDPANNCVG